MKEGKKGGGGGWGGRQEKQRSRKTSELAEDEEEKKVVRTEGAERKYLCRSPHGPVNPQVCVPVAAC